jgi:hypothetical protein
MAYVYYVDGEKFTTDDADVIPWDKLSSPDENTPAYEDLSDGYKFWCLANQSCHRLTGPAVIFSDGNKWFCLNDKKYDNVKEWIKDHPNPDLYFDAIDLNETERVLWFLKN